MTNVIQMTGALDPREAWSATGCTVARALEVLSTRSAFLILREAFYGTTRFHDFARRAQVSEPVAAARLRELVAEGMLEQHAYQEAGQRTRQEYRLTEKGADLLPAIVALMQWGDRWLDEGAGPVMLRHRGCGERAGVELRCAAGHEIGAGDLELALNR